MDTKQNYAFAEIKSGDYIFYDIVGFDESGNERARLSKLGIGKFYAEKITEKLNRGGASLLHMQNAVRDMLYEAIILPLEE